MGRVFSNWYLDDRAWIIGPLAIWIVAFLSFSVVRMASRRRWMARSELVRELGIVWKLTFAAAVAWLVGWSVWLTVAAPD